MAYEIINKVAFVTGGANGIGEAIVKDLLQEGAKHVAIIDIAEEAGLRLQNSLNTKYGPNKAKFIKCDVTNDEQFFAAFTTVKEENGDVDLLVNNAGIFSDGPQAYRREIDLNFKAAVTGTLKGLEMMRKDQGGKGGAIINVASVAGLCQMPYLPIYWATKSAIIQFSNCIGMDDYYLRTDVRVIAICFGVTDTAIIKSDNIGLIDEHLRKGVDEILRAFPIQKAESAARGLINVYKLGTSGSTWLVMSDKSAEDITSNVKKAYAIMSKPTII